VICRTYDYGSEQKCDRHTAVFLKAINTVAQMPGTNFAAIKVTALGNPMLLERMSSALLSIQQLFKRFDVDGEARLPPFLALFQ
jgi:proline dehydrogenase